MRPSVFVRTQYWYAEGVPATSNFHTGLLQTVWKCESEKQPRLALYLAASFSVSCRASRETQTQILRTTALFDETGLAENSTETILFGRGLYPWRKALLLGACKKVTTDTVVWVLSKRDWTWIRGRN